jgi:hypothetical protein
MLTELERELLDALKEALMPVEMYRAYGWSDRARVIPKIKTATTRAEAKAKESQCDCGIPEHPVCDKPYNNDEHDNWCLNRVGDEECSHDRACHAGGPHD